MKTAGVREFGRLIERSASYVIRLRDADRLVLTEDGKRILVAESVARIAATEPGQPQNAAARAAHAARREEGAEDVPRETSADGNAADPGAESGGPAEEEKKPERGTVAYWNAIDAEERARMRRLERRRMEGELVERADVEFVMNDFGSTLRRLAEQRPAQEAPRLVHLKSTAEAQSVLEEILLDLTREVADAMARRAKEVMV